MSSIAETIARLLSPASATDCVYHHDAGISLGGRPATEFTRGQWAKAVALVSQEPVLFSGARAGRDHGHALRVQACDLYADRNLTVAQAASSTTSRTVATGGVPARRSKQLPGEPPATSHVLTKPLC